jgi:hypothetical protein
MRGFEVLDVPTEILSEPPLVWPQSSGKIDARIGTPRTAASSQPPVNS